jgi:hypothetical protein
MTKLEELKTAADNAWAADAVYYDYKDELKRQEENSDD